MIEISVSFGTEIFLFLNVTFSKFWYLGIENLIRLFFILLIQTKMAMILGFGTNQYRLYEMGEVPSESNGKMIRSAMNPQVFLDLVRSTRSQLTDKEYAKIITRVDEVIKASERWQDELKETKRLFRTERGMVNGFAPLSTDRLKNLLLYLLRQMGETSPTKMNEVLFYIDFFSYRERGMAISGLAYQSLELGPAPQRWKRVYSAFDEVEVQLKLVHGQESTRLKADVEADMGGFYAEEMAVIDTVCEKMKRITSKEVAKMGGEAHGLAGALKHSATEEDEIGGRFHLAFQTFRTFLSPCWSFF